MTVKSSADFIVTSWSGGTTTQLYISPENSSFAARDFDVRISTAVVEAEESDFTQFPGYDRILCVLDGHLKMVHSTTEGEKETELSPLQQAYFSGDWKTRGFGKVRDFNVIFRKGIRTELEILRQGKLKLSNKRMILFPLSEGLEINSIRIPNGQLAVLDHEKSCSVDISEDSIVLMVLIHG